MTGVVEAGLVIGLIAGIADIIDKTKQIWDTAHDIGDVPEAFNEVAPKLKIVKDILKLANNYIKDSTRAAESYTSLKEVADNCKVKATKLQEIFQKVLAKDDDSRLVRYKKAVGAVVKGNRVEELMEAILKDLDLLGTYLNFEEKTKKKVQKAIDEVSDIDPSLVDNSEDGKNIHSGKGPQNLMYGSGTAYFNTLSGDYGVQVAGGSPIINTGKGKND